MESIRKWFYRPKRDDKSLLAQFFYADESLNMIANELDSFDGRKDPERCTTLVNQLRQSQDKVLTITNGIMDVLIGDERANRDFRVKFPEDVLQENLAGQLWFGAECLAAGSSIMNREAESTAMRPLAKAVTKSLDNVRNLLRETCLRNNTPNGPIKLDNNELITEMLLESLKIFDKLFAEFELAYVSAMVPVKSTHEYELQECIGVLFSETLQRALKMKLLTQEMIDDCDPALMFTIPRLAIVSGLLIYPSGPLCIDKSIDDMSNMFRPFRTLLIKIRQLLWTLNKRELYMLEKLLCDNEQISDIKSVSDVDVHSDIDKFIDRFYNDYTLGTTINHTDSFFTSINITNTTTIRKDDLTNNKSHKSNCKIDKPSLSNTELPSTSSGYLIPNSIAHDIIVTSITNTPPTNDRNLSSDTDSLEIISVAAATLSSILTTTNTSTNTTTINNKNNKIESPNDSGISTETTSLDQSPILDCHCKHDNNSSSSSTIETTKSLCNCAQLINSTIKKLNICTNCLNKSTIINKKNIIESIDEDLSSIEESTDTSSFNSNCGDDEEIALAIQAAELASKNNVRSKYNSSEDLIHRLYVCIAGVADQLQTNFASDLRNILKSVFLMNTTTSDNDKHNNLDTSTTSLEYRPSEEDVIENNEFSVDPNILAQEALFDTNVYFHLDRNDNDINNDYTNHPRSIQDDRNLSTLSQDLNRYASLREDVANLQSNNIVVELPQTNNDDIIERPPIWIPDIEAPKCMSCGVNFTVVKRRHHCRNCGKIFCSRCSSNSVPLPKFGHLKPVRVCNKCFIYNITPFTM